MSIYYQICMNYNFIRIFMLMDCKLFSKFACTVFPPIDFTSNTFTSKQLLP